MNGDQGDITGGVAESCNDRMMMGDNEMVIDEDSDGDRLMEIAPGVGSRKNNNQTNL